MEESKPKSFRGVPIWLVAIIVVVVCVCACLVGLFVATPVAPDATASPKARPSVTPPAPTSTPTITVSATSSDTATITPTPSKTPVPSKTSPPTKTPDPRAQYAVIDIRELDGYTDNHQGEKVKLEGKVFNVGQDFFQINVRKPGGSTYDTIPVITTYLVIPKPPGIYEDINVIVYGMVFGRQEGTNAFGGAISQLWVDALIIEVSK